MNRWQKKADEALAPFHGVGAAVREAVAVALEAAYEEGRAAPREADDEEDEDAPGPG